MNALQPTGLPAACVRGAGRRGPRPIGPCAGIAAKSVARASAQDARRPRRLAYNTAAETRNGAACLRVTGAGGAIGHGRDARTCTRCGTHPPVEGGTVCEPCHVARRVREREQYAMRRTAGLCGRCGTPAPSDAACCDRCARSAAKRSRKKAKNARSRQRYVQRRVRAALYRLRRTIPGRVPVSPVRPPVLGAFGRASRSAGSAASSYGHRDRHGRQSWLSGAGLNPE